MSLPQRKKDLVSWISELDDESLLAQVEAVKQAANGEKLPLPILELLESSRNTAPEDLIPHRSVRDLLNR